MAWTDRPHLPFCGSGTFCIEAALIARGIAPGVFRQGYAFEKWPDFDRELFERIYNDDSAEHDFEHHIYGRDNDPKAVGIARRNVRAAGLSKDITIDEADFRTTELRQADQQAIIITNPPYGERISTPNLLATYKMIGEKLKHEFQGNEAWILSYREECFEQIGLRPSIKIPVFNGSLECEFRKYQMFQGKLKDFRGEGNILKTEEEKEAMAEKHRFKKNREFKKRIEEDDHNEKGDIRSFTFHKHHPAFDERLFERKEEKSFRKKREDRGERNDGRRNFRDGNDRRSYRDNDDRRSGRERRDFRDRRDSRGRRDFNDDYNKRGGKRFDKNGRDFKRNNRRYQDDDEA